MKNILKAIRYEYAINEHAKYKYPALFCKMSRIPSLIRNYPIKYESFKLKFFTKMPILFKPGNNPFEVVQSWFN